MKAHELELSQTYIQSHVHSAAREVELQPISAACSLMSTLPLNYAGRLLVHMLPPHAARICRELPEEQVIHLLDNADVNHVVAILRCLSKSKRRNLLTQMPEKTATIARLLLAYSEDMVGACMCANILSIPSDISVDQALQRLALSSYHCDNNKIPVVNDDYHLIGVINIRALLSAHKDSKIEHLLDTAFSPISSRASLHTIAEHESWQSHETLFVLNRRRELIGFLRHQDLRKSLQQLSLVSEASEQPSLIKDISLAYLESIGALFEMLLGRSKVRGLNK